MLASDVMTHGVITIQPKTEVKEIVDLMIRNRISGLPVVNEHGRVVGIVSEGDLMRRVENNTERRDSWWLTALFDGKSDADAYIRSHARRAEDLMTRNPVTISDDTPLYKVAEALEKNHIKRVPVTRDGKLVGIISRSNLLQGFSASERQTKPAGTASDADIRRKIMDEMENRLRISGITTNVVVRDGEVDLWGIVENDAQLRAAGILAEEVAGVAAVRNNLKVLAVMPNPA